MYYTKLAVQQRKDRIYIYKRGDECINVTGGWVITGSAITKEVSRIVLQHSPSSGRYISTVNTIEITKNDRIFIVLSTSGSAPNYGFIFGTKSPIDATFIGSGFSQSSLNGLTEVVRELYSSIDRLSTVYTSNYFGVWYIHEIYIDKY